MLAAPDDDGGGRGGEGRGRSSCARRSRCIPTAGPRDRVVAHAFADDGPLARALPQFEPRAGQRAMARAVADVLDDGGVLLAEAGTGTGKTWPTSCRPS